MKKLWQALLLVRRCDRRSFRLRVLYVTLQSVLPLLNLYVLKLLVDAVSWAIVNGGSESGEWRVESFTLSAFHFPLWSPMVLLGAMVAVFLVGRVVHALNGVNNDVLAQRLVDYMADVMQRQSARLDMAYYDNPDYYDSLHRAQQEASSRPLAILGNFMALFGSLLSIGGVVVMLAATSWWVIGVMVVAVVPSFAVRLYKARRVYAFRRENTQQYRRTAYYSALLSSRDYAKEMRAYNLTLFFRRRFVATRRGLVKELLGISRRFGGLDVLTSLVEAGAMFAVVWLLIGQAFAGAITIGTFVMLFEAFRRGQGYLSSFVASIAALYDNRLFVSNLFDFLDFKPQIVSPADLLPFPAEVSSIELRDVTFRYPDMQHDVLSHYSLVAKRGTVTRIEGQNGFGKSTVVKLLLRLYDPDAGAVLVNGTDIRRFGLEELRRGVAVLFQDFGRYALTAAENIAFEDEESLGNESGKRKTAKIERIRRAAALAHADTIVSTLPEGFDNMLGRTFDGGAELSMGQWQRLALARLFYTDAPVLVLDEPTAWMDMPTRELFNETIDRIKHDKIIIIISHQ